MINFLAIFLAAFFVALASTPLAIRLARRWNVMAKPGGRRKHSQPIPKLGGVSLTLAYLAGIALVYLLMPPVGDDALRLRGDDASQG